MATRLATGVVNAMADAAVDRMDLGSGAGTIKVYTGSQPASANDTEGGATLLATFTMADPAFGAASAGVASIASAPRTTTGAAAGTAGWFRAEDSDGTNCFDGSVTATGGGGQLELNSTTISVGVSVEITSGTFTMPAT